MPRRFIRHPAAIPIQLVRPIATHKPKEISQTQDVSAGGVSCLSNEILTPGEVIEVEITLEPPPFRTLGHIVWCKNYEGGYLVGIGFSDAATAYAVRMVEQVCYIEEYRLQQHHEGRELTQEEAANEWIAVHAASFHQNEH